MRWRTEGYLFIPKEFHAQGAFFHIGLTAKRKAYASTGSADLELWISQSDQAPVSMEVWSLDPQNVKQEDIWIMRGGSFLTPGSEIIFSGFDLDAHVSVEEVIQSGADLADCHLIVDEMFMR